MIMHTFALILLALAPSTVISDKPAIKTVETPLYGEAHEFEGFEQRATVTSAVALALNQDVAGAWKALDSALAYCDAKRSSSAITYASVATQEEASELRKSKSPSVSLVLIDMACPAAYKTAAFLSVGSGHASKAFAFLDKAQALAPFWAEPYTERAYLLRKLGDNENALVFYRKALNLANTHKSSANVRAMAYRGIGFVLTEKGELDAARKAYQDSLLIDPANQLAKDELIYIDKLQAAKH